MNAALLNARGPLVLGPLTAEEVPSVLAIADEQLGPGYLDASWLARHIERAERFCDVARIGGAVAGFSLMEVASPHVIASRLQGDLAWFTSAYGGHARIGYRSLTAVGDAHQGRGVANALVAHGLAVLAQRVPIVVCEAWKSTTTHIGRTLERHGYRVVREIPGYWAEASVRLGYDCRRCGAPPCACSAVFYVRTFD